jgi:hypothetical protein
MGGIPRWTLVTLGVAVLLLVIIRIVLDPLATHYTRRALNRGDGFEGAVSRVHVTVLPPAVRIERLKIIESPKGKWDNPLYYFESIRASILWREILHGHLVADVVVNRPKLRLLPHHEAASGKKAATVSEQLEALSPLRVDRLEVDDGELLVAHAAGERDAHLWIHGADLVAENLATRKALMEGEYAKLHGSAWIQRSGKLTFAVNMDPFAKQLTFTAKAALRDLDLRELYAFTSDRTDLRATQGRIDLHADVRARDGELTGGVKPELKNVEVKSAKKDLGDKIKAALADAAIHLVSKEDQGERKVATVIPIKGKISDPHAQLVPTVLGVLRNAFVEGLAGGFADLPPETAPKKEGVIKQTVKALKKGEGPPEAQPERHGRTPPRKSSDSTGSP